MTFVLSTPAAAWRLMDRMMKQPTWPKVFAFTGLAVIGLALAYFATALTTGGVTATSLGRDPSGSMVLTGSAVLMAGIAVAAVFGFLAIVQARALQRGRA